MHDDNMMYVYCIYYAGNAGDKEVFICFHKA